MQQDLGTLFSGDKIEKVTLDPVGDDKVRVNHSSFSDPVVIRAEEALFVLAIGKRLFLCRGDRPAAYLNLDMTGLEGAGYGPVTK
jgi:hypothetical protein